MEWNILLKFLNDSDHIIKSYVWYFLYFQALAISYDILTKLKHHEWFDVLPLECLECNMISSLYLHFLKGKKWTFL